MQAITFQARGEYKYQTDYPLPEPEKNEVVIKVNQCGLCGTDAHIYNGEFEANFPVVIGHEFSGTVDSTGSKVKNFTSGDRVTLNPNTICNKCEFCRNGKENLCVTLPGLGVNSDGGFAEYAAVPERCVYHIPDRLSFAGAAFTEPLSCALHGIDLAKINPGDVVVVLGSGPTGLLLAQLAKLSGASIVITTAKRKKRLEVAKELGATEAIDVSKVDLLQGLDSALDGKGVDVVLEAVGSEETMKQSLQIPKEGGRIVWFGVASPDLEVPVKPFEVYRKELTIRGSFVNPYTTQRAIDLLAENKIRTDKLITHYFSLDKFDEAIDTYENDDSRIKIMMKP